MRPSEVDDEQREGFSSVAVFRKFAEERRLSVEMAHSSGDHWTGRLRCSYKRATFVLCTSNILVALFMLHASLSPVYYDSSSSSPAPGAIGTSLNGLEGVVVQTKEELERIEDSNRLRRELLPVHLIERVKEIQEETEFEINRTAALNLTRQKVALELVNRLRELKLSNGQATQKALEEWKKRKLEKSGIEIAPARGGEEKAVDARVQVLGEGTLKDLKHSDGESTQKVDMEHEIIPGREVPSECHAEAHTDYSGIAVRWGLTHHVNSAADCCKACLDQARNATEEQKKCNVWVYCPSEGGCHSPDKYTHKNHECWLKQADEPQINFKGHYDEEYKQQHPTAPSIVPWVSGVVP